MSIKAKIEAIIYAAEEPVMFAQIFALVKDEAQQELLARRARTGSSPETEAGIIPTEDDHEANLAAEPTDAPPPPDVPMQEIPVPGTALPVSAGEQDSAAEPELGTVAAAIAAAEPQPVTEAEMKSVVR